MAQTRGSRQNPILDGPNGRLSSNSGFAWPKRETFVKIRVWMAQTRDIPEDEALDGPNARQPPKSGFGWPKRESFVEMRLWMGQTRGSPQNQARLFVCRFAALTASLARSINFAPF